MTPAMHRAEGPRACRTRGIQGPSRASRATVAARGSSRSKSRSKRSLPREPISAKAKGSFPGCSWGCLVASKNSAMAMRPSAPANAPPRSSPLTAPSRQSVPASLRAAWLHDMSQQAMPGRRGENGPLPARLSRDVAAGEHASSTGRGSSRRLGHRMGTKHGAVIHDSTKCTPGTLRSLASSACSPAGRMRRRCGAPDKCSRNVGAGGCGRLTSSSGEGRKADHARWGIRIGVGVRAHHHIDDASVQSILLDGVIDGRANNRNRRADVRRQGGDDAQHSCAFPASPRLPPALAWQLHQRTQCSECPDPPILHPGGRGTER